jgi:simple sugar transport system permease protein
MIGIRLLRAAGAAVGLLLVLLLTLLIFKLPIGESLRLLGTGAFGDKFALSRTAVKATPLLLTGLGVLIAWRAGMYNIGGEGQFVMGGLFGAVVAKLMIHGDAGLGLTAVILAAGIVGGAAWAWLAGWLYARRGVEVVISTILLNFVALELLDWAVNGPLKEREGGLPLSDALPDGVMLHKFDPQMDLHIGVFIALAAAFAIHIFLSRTKWGFKLRLVGSNPTAARANRIDAKGAQIGAMVLSGALCGLAGGVEYVGIAGQVGKSFSQGWGFLAIPVALLGALHPGFTVLSAIYFGALFAGSENMARYTSAGTTLIYVIQAAAVLGLVALQAWSQRRPVQVEAD